MARNGDKNSDNDKVNIDGFWTTTEGQMRALALSQEEYDHTQALRVRAPADTAKMNNTECEASLGRAID